MSSGWIVAIVSVLAVVGQLANLFLNLTLRNKILEMERSLLDRVDSKYKLKEVCTSEMDSMDRRLCPMGANCPLARAS